MPPRSTPFSRSTRRSRSSSSSLPAALRTRSPLLAYRGAIHHIDLTVASLERSAPFYECLLGAVGFRMTGKDEHTVSFLSRFAAIDLHPALRTILHDRHTPGLHHLALHAGSREQVDAAHASLCELGAAVLDPPAVYEGPAYGPDYYAAFFSDPDGLKLEVVHTAQWSPIHWAREGSP